MEEKTMKKRILSVLLLVAMVVTMIPFAVSAEEVPTAAPQAETPATELAGYDAMYVQDGLTALYTTFGANASTANLTTGKWTDLISGKTATLVSTDIGTWVSTAASASTPSVVTWRTPMAMATRRPITRIS